MGALGKGEKEVCLRLREAHARRARTALSLTLLGLDQHQPLSSDLLFQKP